MAVAEEERRAVSRGIGALGLWLVACVSPWVRPRLGASSCRLGVRRLRAHVARKAEDLDPRSMFARGSMSTASSGDLRLSQNLSN